MFGICISVLFLKGERGPVKCVRVFVSVCVWGGGERG